MSSIQSIIFILFIYLISVSTTTPLLSVDISQSSSISTSSSSSSSSNGITIVYYNVTDECSVVGNCFIPYSSLLCNGYETLILNYVYSSNSNSSNSNSSSNGNNTVSVNYYTDSNSNSSSSSSDSSSSSSSSSSGDDTYQGNLYVTFNQSCTLHTLYIKGQVNQYIIVNVNITDTTNTGSNDAIVFDNSLEITQGQFISTHPIETRYLTMYTNSSLVTDKDISVSSLMFISSTATLDMSSNTNSTLLLKSSRISTVYGDVKVGNLILSNGGHLSISSGSLRVFTLLETLTNATFTIASNATVLLPSSQDTTPFIQSRGLGGVLQSSCVNLTMSLALLQGSELNVINNSPSINSTITFSSISQPQASTLSVVNSSNVDIVHAKTLGLVSLENVGNVNVGGGPNITFINNLQMAGGSPSVSLFKASLGNLGYFPNITEDAINSDDSDAPNTLSVTVQHGVSYYNINDQILPNTKFTINHCGSLHVKSGLLIQDGGVDVGPMGKLVMTSYSLLVSDYVTLVDRNSYLELDGNNVMETTVAVTNGAQFIVKGLILNGYVQVLGNHSLMQLVEDTQATQISGGVYVDTYAQLKIQSDLEIEGVLISNGSITIQEGRTISTWTAEFTQSSHISFNVGNEHLDAALLIHGDVDLAGTIVVHIHSPINQEITFTLIESSGSIQYDPHNVTVLILAPVFDQKEFQYQFQVINQLSTTSNNTFVLTFTDITSSTPNYGFANWKIATIIIAVFAVFCALFVGRSIYKKQNITFSNTNDYQSLTSNEDSIN